MINLFDVIAFGAMLVGVMMFSVTIGLYLIMALCVMIIWGCFGICVFILANEWLDIGHLIVVFAGALYFVVGYVLSRDWLDTVFGE